MEKDAQGYKGFSASSSSAGNVENITTLLCGVLKTDTTDERGNKTGVNPNSRLKGLRVSLISIASQMVKKPAVGGSPARFRRINQ